MNGQLPMYDHKEPHEEHQHEKNPLEKHHK